MTETKLIKAPKAPRTTTLPAPELGQAHLLSARHYLAHLEARSLGEGAPTRVEPISQEAMAERLGCSYPNTYSKWERGHQKPPSMVGRELELLIYQAMWMTGEHTPENPPTLKPFLIEHLLLAKKDSATKVIGEGTSARTIPIKRTRHSNAARELALLHRDTYMLFSECDVERDGYMMYLKTRQFTLKPGFNSNGKLRGAPIDILDRIIAHLNGQPFNKKIQVSRETMIEQYKFHGYTYNGAINLGGFVVRRRGDDLVFTLAEGLFEGLCNFLLEACRAIKDEEASELSNEQADLYTLRMVEKMDGATQLENGSYQLTGNQLKVEYAYSGNYRLKYHEINHLEKLFCKLINLDPKSIKTPATVLVRDSLYERGLTTPVSTHLFTVELVGKSFIFTPNKVEYIELFNNFIKNKVKA